MATEQFSCVRRWQACQLDCAVAAREKPLSAPAVCLDLNELVNVSVRLLPEAFSSLLEPSPCLRNSALQEILHREHSAQLRRLYLPRFRRILVQRQVRARLVIIRKISGKHSSQTGLVENDHMIQAFPPNGANQPLDISSLPR
jgi:hypothetical protein